MLIDGHYESHLSPPQVLSLKSGVDFSVEEEANRWLARSREGITALSEKRDYLTHDQLLLRNQRELLVMGGTPEEAYRRGMFRRTFNPLAGQRPGKHRDHD